MKSFTPNPQLRNTKVFTALLIAFTILVTPVMPVVAAAARNAGHVKSNSSGNNPTASEALKPLAPATTIIEASKADSFPDPNNDGKAEPGDTITYDVNVKNTGAVDATGVNFADTIDPNTTLVPGSLRVSPLAFAESYNATINTALNIPAPGVLANDTGTPAPTAQPIAAGATAQGGTVTLNADGSFNYTPPSGFTGTDTFTYTATNGLSPDDTATVTINVDEGPAVTTTAPANGANNVATNTNITVNFSEPVNATTSSFVIECPTGSPQAYALSASPAASFTLDPVADLPAGVTCTVTVVASQISDADTFDPPDQMAADYVFSFGVKPVAVDDMESATGNVRINSANSGYSVLTNDQGAGITITAYDATSTQGGSVNMNTATGTFTYNPPRGFEGADSFNYTISSAGGSDQGTVVITVSDMIWFINNAPGACSSGCDGRLTNPYTTLAAFEADNGSVGSGNPEAGDNVFIYTGSGNYVAPLTLENNQIVIGQGASSSIAAITGITPAPDSDPLPSTGGTKPNITSSGIGVQLAQNDQLHGLAFTTTGAAVSGTSNVGTFLFGDIAINNTTGSGMVLTGGGSVTSTGVNTITTTTATALNVANTSIGAGGITFRSISSNGGANAAIVLNNTGTSGGLTVAGNGAAGTGGTIQNKSVDSISLTSTSNVSLSWMNIQNNTESGIFGTGVTGLNLTRVNLTNNGNDNGDEGIKVNNLLGNSTWSFVAISNSAHNNVFISNTLDQATAKLDSLTVSNSSFNNLNDTTGANSFLVDISANAGVDLIEMTGCTFSNNSPQQALVVQARNTATITKFTVQSSTFTDNGIQASFTQDASANLTFNVLNNLTMTGSQLQAINVFSSSASTGGTLQGRIVGNQIGNAGVPDSGSAFGSGIRVLIQGKTQSTLLLDGNTIRQTPFNRGIEAQYLGSTAPAQVIPASDITVTNNNVNPQDASGFPLAAIFVTSDNQGSPATVRADIRGNTVPAASDTYDYPNFDGTGPNLVLEELGGGTTQLVDSPPASANATAQLQSTNTGSAYGNPGVALIAGPINQPPLAMLQQEIENNGSVLAQTDKPATTDRPASVSGKRALDNAEVLLAHGRSAPKARALSPAPAPSGETVNATIGTLPAGKTVHIQFQVTVDNPFTGAQPQVSNQGTVSGDNFTSVQTDDPADGGSADPTVTPILTPPDISIHDASASEPSSGSAPAAFAVVLSHAYSQTVTVNFSTANGGANPATAGSDYTTTSGSVTFNPGETLQTISVPVLADADNSETDETFLVNLTGTNVGVITDSQAVGTITANSTPGTVIISELRTSGPAGADDDFVELLNNTDTDITVTAPGGWALAKVGASCSDTPIIVAVIPNGTVIPARGNYLLVGSTYSLGVYATGDQILTANIEDDRNVALFNTADIANFQTSTRLDAVGFGTNTGNNCDLFREGATLQPASGSMSEYSFVRKVDKGETLDTNDNAADFVVVSTTPGTPVGSNNAPTLGAPGPENKTGARGPVPCNVPGASAKFDRARLDASQGVGAPPNLVHDATSDPVNNSTYGTMDFRRTFTNNTGGSVTRLRFRIVDMTTSPAAASSADLRARSSSVIVVGPSTVQGTTLETPPVQALGGGVNSTLAASTVTLGTPLANGASINLRFLFGIEQHGDYRIGIVIETLTSGNLGQDVWELRGHTQNGGDSDGGCNTPPVANAGADQTIECAGASTSVTLDGSASTDPDGDTPLTYEWREGVTVLGTGVTLNTSLPFGSHTITLKVTDPSGAFSEDTVTVNVVDTTNPLITAPPNVSVSTGPGATSCSVFISNATLGNATASDGCSASVTITRTGVPTGNNFPVGQTIITYTADDGHGHTASAMQTVTVTDNTPPTLSVPPNQTVNAPPNSCSANVNPGTATANDNCPGVTVTGVRSDSQPLNAPYPVGVTTITWTAKDAANNTTTGNQTITVKDATAPVITLTTGTIELNPPNHSYQTFTIANLVASVSDQCDASVDINDVVISQVTSDEIENGNGDGNTDDDIVITPDCKSVQLRRERQGNGDGRVYKITLKVKDSSGNVTTAVRQVIVRKGNQAVVDSGVHYTVNGCTP